MITEILSFQITIGTHIRRLHALYRNNMKHLFWSIAVTGLSVTAIAQNNSHSKTTRALPERRQRVSVTYSPAQNFPLKSVANPVCGLNGHLFPAGSIVALSKEKGKK
jgi:hypothetical protein